MSYNEYVSLESAVYDLMSIARDCGSIRNDLHRDLHSDEPTDINDYREKSRKMEDCELAMYAKKREILKKLADLVNC